MQSSWVEKPGLNRILWRWISLPGILIYLVIWVLSPIHPVRAGELKATVRIFLDRLPLVRREKLKDFQQVIEDYINGQMWVEEDQANVTCTMLMYLEDESTTFEDRYRARIYVSNNADIQYRDQECLFPYQAGELLVYKGHGFDPLTGLIEFYLYLIVGGELDKLKPFGGEPYFKKAREVCHRANFGRSEFFKGWDRRTEIVDDILSRANRPFREMKAVYFKGLGLERSGDRQGAREHLLKALGMLEQIQGANPKDEKVKEFLEHHHLELAKILVSEGQGVYGRLVRLDPEHQGVYKKYLRKYLRK